MDANTFETGAVSLALVGPDNYQAAETTFMNIEGPLASKAVEGMCGYVDGYDAIEARYKAAMQEDTKAVVIRFSTPGGDVAGLEQSLARMVKAKSKPVVAYVDESCASAGVFLATKLADKIVVPEAGFFGSIGVMRIRSDQTGAAEQQGVKFKAYRYPAGKAESLSVDPINELADERNNRMVETAAKRFIASVAESRNISTQAVEKLNGAMLTAAEAKQAGLIDAIGDMEMAYTLAHSGVSKVSMDKAENIEMASVLEAVEAKSLAEAIGKIDSLKQAAAAGKEAVAKLAAIEAEHDNMKATVALDKARSEGRLTADREAQFSNFKTKYGLNAALDMLNAFEPAVNLKAPPKAPPPASKEDALAASEDVDEDTVASLKRHGLSVEDYLNARKNGAA